MPGNIKKDVKIKKIHGPRALYQLQVKNNHVFKFF